MGLLSDFMVIDTLFLIFMISNFDLQGSQNVLFELITGDVDILFLLILVFVVLSLLAHHFQVLITQTVALSPDNFTHFFQIIFAVLLNHGVYLLIVNSLTQSHLSRHWWPGIAVCGIADLSPDTFGHAVSFWHLNCNLNIWVCFIYLVWVLCQF